MIAEIRPTWPKSAPLERHNGLHEYTSAEWDDVLATNLRGVFLAMKYEIPYMLANGGGNIVVTSSSNALATTEKKSAYTASKRGLVGLVQSAALDYVSKGIRVNTLIPDTTDTALVRRVAHMEDVPDSVWEAAASANAKLHIPMGRMATPQEVATFALALASDDFPYMTAHRWSWMEARLPTPDRVPPLPTSAHL